MNLLTMAALSRNVLLYGHEADLPRPIPLRAGPLSLLFENGDLRYVRFGKAEIIRRIYVAVRDRNWGTIAMRISNLRVDANDDRFTITFAADHCQREIDFHWEAAIQGSPEGRLSFSMQGEARSTFLRNRIGFCVLHPPDCAGRPCRVVQQFGDVVEKPFPRWIAPAPKDDPFQEIREMSYEAADGVWADLSFEGDIFETEDQRNWSDGSYKTFCTPLRLPFPVEIQAGTQVSQRVELHVRADTILPAVDATESRIRIGTESAPLPELGLCLSAVPHDARQIARLKALSFAHVRADLHLSAARAREKYLRAVKEAAKLGVPLEVAIYVSKPAVGDARCERELAELAAWVHPEYAIARWLVFQEGQKTTGPDALDAARRALSRITPLAQFGGGSDAYFTELNRERPDLSIADVICYSINPQVHAFDNTSLVENALAIAYTIESARELSHGKRIAITPVTLRPRANELLDSVDPRQMSLFGAVWTLASLKAIAESGATSATYYETVGWRGVMERDEGPTAPERFCSIAGGVFPLYHVFRAVGEFAGGEVLRCECSRPLDVTGLVLRKSRRLRILLANLTPERQQISIEGAAGEYREHRLDESSAIAAMEQPEEFAAADGAPRSFPGDGAAVELSPYGLAWLDRTYASQDDHHQ